MCSVDSACQGVWIAFLLGGFLGVLVMGVFAVSTLRRLDSERNYWRDRCRDSEALAGAATGPTDAQGSQTARRAYEDIARDVIERERTLDRLPWLRRFDDQA